jgi:hypothetical protein
LPHLAVLIHEGKCQPLRELRPDLPAEVEAVVARAMAVEPEHRFPTVRAFREALDAVASGAPLSAFLHTGALDKTVAAGLSMPPPNAASAPGVSVASQRPGKRTATWLVGALVVAGLAAIALVIALTRGPSPGEKETIVPASEPEHSAAPTAERAPQVVSDLEPRIEPALDAAGKADSGSASPDAGNPARARAAASPPASGARPEKPSPSRAKQHGLIEENPF